MVDTPTQNSLSKGVGIKIRVFGTFGLALVVLVLGVFWGGRWWIEKESILDIFERDRPTAALARLTSWNSLMLAPKKWYWLRNEAARKSNDRARLKRLTDESATAGLPSEQAYGPKWLLEASSGASKNAMSNLAKLLLLYGEHRDEVYSAIIQGFLVKGNHENSAQLLRLWKEDTDATPTYYYWDGVAAISNYELTRASESLRKAIEAKPDFAKARLELAELYLEQADFRKAKEEFAWLVQNDPENTRIIIGYARLLVSDGAVDEAIAELAKLKNAESLPTAELSLICETNIEANNLDVALKQTELLLKRWPNAIGVLKLASDCNRKLGNIETSEAISKRSELSQARRNEIDQMLAQLNKEPDNQVLRRNVGELMMNYLEPAAGAGYVEIVAMVTPLDIKAHQLLATYYNIENNPERAQAHEQAIKQISERLAPNSDSSQ